MTKTEKDRHETGRVRGLFCYNCNVAIGLMQHDEARLEAAVDYLERSKAQCAEDS
jgi:hypothetical protein